ncbi:hypothetical protein [Catellatospora sichuanensis]|uniref:hypothetical protein n=1 Tax=Catellatospora sichuanensis TaxID=1969805 RepID=UPI001182EF8C|nr:hypothetical protein [Catellatospora sichuanensis]
MVTRLAEREWPVLVSTVRLGEHRYRVVRSARPPAFAGLREGRLGAQLCVDKHSAAMFAMAWGLAARSPHTIVYLPLRAAAAADPCDWGRPLDLVLLHHSLAFPPSRWKEVRTRLGAGRPHTVTLPAEAWPSRPVADHHRTWHQEYRDHLLWSVAADTLVLTGSREAYELQAAQVRELAEDSPAYLAQTPDAHCCAEIPMGVAHRFPQLRRPYGELHIQYCP